MPVYCQRQFGKLLMLNCKKICYVSGVRVTLR